MTDNPTMWRWRYIGKRGVSTGWHVSEVRVPLTSQFRRQKQFEEQPLYAHPPASAEPVAWRVHSAQTGSIYAKNVQWFYPTSCESDAKKAARFMRAECEPLYAQPPASSLHDVGVRAKTIEECAKVADGLIGSAHHQIAAAIRALSTEAAPHDEVQAAFYPIDGEDWDYLENLLVRNTRHSQDSQTLIWRDVVKKLRAALSTPPKDEK